MRAKTGRIDEANRFKHVVASFGFKKIPIPSPFHDFYFAGKMENGSQLLRLVIDRARTCNRVNHVYLLNSNAQNRADCRLKLADSFSREKPNRNRSEEHTSELQSQFHL